MVTRRLCSLAEFQIGGEGLTVIVRGERRDGMKDREDGEEEGKETKGEVSIYQTCGVHHGQQQ